MNDLTIPLVVFAGLLTVNAVLSGVLYLHHRTALYRTFFLFWIVSTISLAVQGLVQSSPALVFPSGFSIFAVNICLTDLLRRTFEFRARWRVYAWGLVGATLASTLLVTISAPFWAIASPMAVASAWPLFDVIVQAIGKKWRGLTITARSTIVAVLFYALHVLDYPFLRNDPRFAPAGFTIGILAAFALSITVPAIVLERTAAQASEALQTLREEQSRRTEAEHIARQAQKLELVGQLATGVAHDFNNILAVVQCWADIGVKPGADLIQREEARASILTASKQGAALARQLLTIGRRSARSVQELRLDHAVHSAMSVLRRVLPEDIEVVTEHAREVVVSADEMDLQQIVLNFVVNARDAMPRGGRLRVSTGARDVKVEENLVGGRLAPGRWAFLTVEDTGHGIETVVREHIFEPFFTTKPKGAGTGLGLATVAHIARESGGVVGFESEPGRGARFTFYWPEVAVEAAAAHPPAVRKAATPRRPASILVVEDNMAVRKLVQSILQDAGYRVLTASDGDRALEVIVEAKSIDLLCTDGVLPGEPAPTVIAKFEAKYPGRPVLVVSGYVQGDLTTRGIEEGRYRLLHKPFTVADLSEAVAELLERRV